MIVSFGDSKTQRIFNGERVSKYSNDLQHITRRKLRMLNNSHSLADLKVPPSNNLEKMKNIGRKIYSIRVNNQWRICFRWETNNAYDVKLIDYH